MSLNEFINDDLLQKSWYGLAEQFSTPCFSSVGLLVPEKQSIGFSAAPPPFIGHGPTCSEVLRNLAFKTDSNLDYRSGTRAI